jgi:hypothetical protein
MPLYRKPAATSGNPNPAPVVLTDANVLELKASLGLADVSASRITAVEQAAQAAAAVAGTVAELTTRTEAAEAAIASGGAPVTAPASTAIVLDSVHRVYDPLTVAGATTITVTGATKGARAQMVVIANGTNVPAITGASEWGTSFGYLNTAGEANLLDVEHNGHSAIFVWSQSAGGAVAAPAPAPAPAVAPSAPATFTAGAVGTTTQTLSWTAPSTGSPATYTYSIAYRVNGSGGFPSPQLTGLTGLTTTVTGLTPSTAYDYQITATNSAGTGPAGLLSNLSTTASLAVPGPVVSLTAGTPTATTMPLTWSAPTTGGGSITDYVVQYAPAGTSFASPTTFADGTSATTGVTVTGLAESTAYDFRVAPVNATGPGPYASVLNVTTAAAPVGGSAGTPVVFASMANLTDIGNETYEATSAGTSNTASGVVSGTAAGDCFIECQFPVATQTSSMLGLDAGAPASRGYAQCDYLTQLGSTGTVTYSQNSMTMSASTVTLPAAPGSRVGLRRVGTTVTLETTTDDWATSTVRHTFPGSSTGPLSANCFTTYSTTPRRLCQPRVTGFA